MGTVAETVRILLDTHALLWWGLDDPHLSRTAATVIGSADTVVHVSAASAWEIATKVRRGRLEVADWLAADLGNYLAAQGFRALSVTLEHALRAGRLPGPHNDPFDRMLIAQAQAEQLALVSNETVFDVYGVLRVW